MSDVRVVKFDGMYAGYNILTEVSVMQEDVCTVLVADNAIEMHLCVTANGRLKTVFYQMMLPCPVTEAMRDE